MELKGEGEQRPNPDKDIGGRRGHARGARKPHKSSPPPGLICKKKEKEGGGWIVAIDTIDQVQSIRQGSDELKQDEGSNEVILTNVVRNLTLKFADGKEKELFLINDKTPLIFRTRKNWTGTGRQVQAISSAGYYIVFAPESCGQRKGTPSVECEGTQYPGITAHYFPNTSDEEADGFEHHPLKSAKERFSLKGEKLHDDSLTKGKLFGGTKPILCDSENWESISLVVVGEEGGGGWSKGFDPKSPPESINPEHSNSEGMYQLPINGNGWFFVRVYGQDERRTQLVYSVDFRYIEALHAIHVNDALYTSKSLILPDKGGHKSTTRIKFDGIDGAQVSRGRAKSRDGRTFLIDNNAKDVNGVTWVFGENDTTDVVIIPPLIWWQFQGRWHSKSIRITKQNFEEWRDEILCIHMPISIPHLSLGFAGSDTKKFRPDPKSDPRRMRFRTVSLSLREFVDDVSLETPIRQPLHLQARLPDDKSIFSLLELAVESKPRPGPKPILSRPCDNRGYSLSEIEAAGLTIVGAREKYAIDRRRRTKHSQYVTALKAHERDEGRASNAR